MSIIIFIIILGVLILVHELGHFFVAKVFRVRVDEFGIGYPPRALKLFTWRGTLFSFNWIPFGGFVKIFGENGESSKDSSMVSAVAPNAGQEKSFIQISRPAQAMVLFAGVAMNIIFAWLLISIGFMFGLPTSTSNVEMGNIENPKLVITAVSPDSPAMNAGLKSGDVILDIANGKIVNSNNTPEGVSEFISKFGEGAVKVTYMRGDDAVVATIIPTDGLIEGRKAIGISMDMIGILSLPFHKAFLEGAKTTWGLTHVIAVGLGKFVFDAFMGASDLSQITGPVGIVSLVGDASRLGFIYLLSFTAFISINLAVINLVPFPALDGGRLLFVLIESIKRSPLSPKVSNAMNTIGFFLLIGLMIFVTIHDVIKLI